MKDGISKRSWFGMERLCILFLVICILSKHPARRALSVKTVSSDFLNPSLEQVLLGCADSFYSSGLWSLPVLGVSLLVL